MRFSTNWLSEYIDLPAEDVLISKIEQYSFEVEGREDYAKNLDEKIVVAKVTAWDKHPNADRLRVVTLEAGNKKIGPVVCGAHNFDVDDKVCLALPGAVIPRNQHDPEGKPFRLTKATIRGVESQGMICSAFELGLGEDAAGILVVPHNARSGESVAKVLADTLIDINVQATNRADVQSYRGMAYEIAAITGKKHKAKPVKNLRVSSRPPVKVKIEDKSTCSRYMGALLVNVKVGPSPDWLARRLLANGMRPINNVVDVTNYVMLEIGLPIHAFDAKDLSSIVIRKSRSGEQIKTLIDDSVRTLPEDILLITEDGEKPIAVAGVVGSRGDRTISTETQSVFIEAAKFDPVSIRSASRALGVRTDASVRFEKNLSIHLLPWALSRTVELLTELTGASLVGVSEAFPERAKLGKRIVIKVALNDVNRLLGIELKFEQIKTILAKSGFVVSKSDKGILNIRVPMWRTDINLPEDVIEEIGRLHGYAKIANIPMCLPSHLKINAGLIVENKRLIENSLVASGFWQNKNYSFVYEKLVEGIGMRTSGLVQVANPLDITQKYLRPSLLPSLISSAAHNFRKYNEKINYFEIGDVFENKTSGFEERTELAAVTVDNRKPEELLLFAKGALENLANELNLPKPQYRAAKIEPYSKTTNTAAHIMISNEIVGSVGLVSPSVAQNFGLKNGFAAYVVLDNLEQFLSFKQPLKYYLPPRFPDKKVDLTFVVSEETAWQSVEEIIEKLDRIESDLIREIQILEVYRDEEKIGKNKKSLTVRFVFQHRERTLRDEEVGQAVEKIKQNLKDKLGAILR